MLKHTFLNPTCDITKVHWTSFFNFWNYSIYLYSLSPNVHHPSPPQLLKIFTSKLHSLVKLLSQKVPLPIFHFLMKYNNFFYGSSFWHPLSIWLGFNCLHCDIFPSFSKTVSWLFRLLHCSSFQPLYVLLLLDVLFHNKSLRVLNNKLVALLSFNHKVFRYCTSFSALN